jgi:hypothetical protein
MKPQTPDNEVARLREEIQTLNIKCAILSKCVLDMLDEVDCHPHCDSHHGSRCSCGRGERQLFIAQKTLEKLTK